jgi:hypothetical protein
VADCCRCGTSLTSRLFPPSRHPPMIAALFAPMPGEVLSPPLKCFSPLGALSSRHSETPHASALFYENHQTDHVHRRPPLVLPED